MDNLAAHLTTSLFLLADAAPEAVVNALPDGAADALSGAAGALSDAAANVDPSTAAGAPAGVWGRGRRGGRSGDAG